MGGAEMDSKWLEAANRDLFQTGHIEMLFDGKIITDNEYKNRVENEIMKLNQLTLATREKMYRMDKELNRFRLSNEEKKAIEIVSGWHGIKKVIDGDIVEQKKL